MKNNLANLYSNIKASKDLLKNYFWRSLQTFGKQGISFAIFVISSKLLSKDDFGIYNYIIAIAFFLTMFADFGISTATSKFVTEYKVLYPERVKRIIFNSSLIIFSIGIAVLLFVGLFGKLIWPENYEYIFLITPLIFLIPICSLYDGVFRGLKKFKAISIISVIAGIISLGLVFILTREFKIYGAFFSQIVFYAIQLVIMAFFYKEISFKYDKKIISDIGKYSFVFGLASLGYFLFSRVDILILGHFGYFHVISVYEVMNKIFTILLLPTSILSQVIAPNITELFVLNKFKELLSKFKKYVFAFFALGIVFTIACLILIPILINIFFHQYYDSILFTILFPVTLFYGSLIYCGVINGGMIVATGQAKLMTIMNLILGVLNLIIALVAVNLFGYIGVMYSTLFSNILGIAILHYNFGRYLIKKTNENEK